MRPDPHSGAKLVQQTVQIVASLRSHDLTLFVMLKYKLLFFNSYLLVRCIPISE
jgi:hypothetical protein